MKNFLLVFLIAILAAGCGTNDKNAQLEKLKKERDRITGQIEKLEKEINPAGTVTATPVLVQPVTLQPFEHFIEVQGRVDGNENIGVSPRTPGVVTKINVREGDYVRKGQVLAEMDAEVLKTTLNELKEQLKFVTELYEKQKTLWDQKIGSEVQFLTAKNNKESLENKIETLEDQIRMSSITSPIDGTVEDIPIKVGQMAVAGQPSFRVINFSRAKAVADVGEAYSAKIKTGDKVRIFLPDYGEEFQQRVTFASKYINPTNRTFVVEIDLSPNNKVFRANMIAVIRIKDYENPSAVTIPQNYIQSSQDEGHYVFVARVENGKKIARKAPVRTGITYNGLTEITDGLSAGDNVIIAGYKDLYEGQVIDYK